MNLWKSVTKGKIKSDDSEGHYAPMMSLAAARANKEAAVCRIMYGLAVFTFTENSPVQIYCAQWINLMIEHINLDVGAASCLTSLVSDNPTVLTKHVKEDHVRLFVDLIHLPLFVNVLKLEILMLIVE